MTITDYPVPQIVAGLNNRTVFKPADLMELAASMTRLGLLQPIGVRRVTIDANERARAVIDPAAVVAWEADPGRIAQLVYGERRFRAAQYAGFQTIRAEVMTLTDEQALARMYAENQDRVQIDPIDEGIGYAGHLADGYTLVQIAQFAGVATSLVESRIALTRLRDDLQKLVRDEKLSLSHAGHLARLDKDHQVVAQRLFTSGRMPAWSVFVEMVDGLYAAQVADDLTMLEGFAVQHMQAIVTANRTGEPVRIARLPTPIHCTLTTRRKGTPLANQLAAWASTLDPHGRDAVFATINALLDAGKISADEHALKTYTDQPRLFEETTHQ